MKFDMAYLCNHPNFKSRRRKLRKEQTDAERKVWSILRRKQIGEVKFYRQYSVGPYIIDFYCPARRFAIELDGSQHGEASQRQYDEKRSEYLAQLGVQVMRFWDDEVMRNIAGVWQKIKEEIEKK